MRSRPGLAVLALAIAAAAGVSLRWRGRTAGPDEAAVERILRAAESERAAARALDELLAAGRADGRATASARATQPATLLVQMRELAGRPAARARAWMCFADADGFRCGVGDSRPGSADGTAELDPRRIASGVAGPRWDVGASGELLFPAASVDAGATHVALIGLRKGTLIGQLRWSDGALPAGGSHVELQWSPFEGDVRRARTPVFAGRFEIGGIAGRAVRLALLEPDERLGPGRLELALDLPPGETIEREFVIDRAARLRVRFRDAESNAPVAGAIWVASPAVGRITEPFLWAVPSDAAGSLVAEDALARGERALLRFRQAAYVPVELRVDVPWAGEVELDLVLERSEVLEGVVEDARGQPLEGLTVSCSRLPVFAADWRRAHATSEATGSDGRFRVKGMQRTQRVALIFDRPWTNPGGRLAWYEITTFDEALARERWIAPDPVLVRGVVRDARGAPIGLRSVVATCAQALTEYRTFSDEHGRFELDGVTPGRWSFGVDGAPQECGAWVVNASTVVEVDVGRLGPPEIEIRLEPPRADWQPVCAVAAFIDATSGAEVDARCTWTGVDVSWGIGSTPLASVVKAVLPEGTYDLLVQAQSYSPKLARLAIDRSARIHVVALEREEEPARVADRR